jgi:hypothetical protein
VERVVLEHVELNGDQLELSGRPLPIGSELEVLIEGRWVAGIVEERPPLHLQFVALPEGYGTSVLVLVCPGLAARWSEKDQTPTSPK